jgi:hypothetical protein
MMTASSSLMSLSASTRSCTAMSFLSNFFKLFSFHFQFDLLLHHFINRLVNISLSVINFFLRLSDVVFVITFATRTTGTGAMTLTMRTIAACSAGSQETSLNAAESQDKGKKKKYLHGNVF